MAEIKHFRNDICYAAQLILIMLHLSFVQSKILRKAKMILNWLNQQFELLRMVNAKPYSFG